MKRCLFFGCAILLLVSCTKRPVSPSKASRRAIDTIYQQQIILIQPQIDSMCAHIEDSIFRVASDSILKERTQEMIELVE